MRYLITLIIFIILACNIGCVKIKHFTLPRHIPDHTKDYRATKKGEFVNSKDSDALIIPPGSKR